MTRRTTSRSAADFDGTSPAIAAQQRIFQLKKERDEKVKDVANKVLADLDKIKHQVSQECEKHERRRKQKKARILTDIAKSMQKRNAIEEDMMAVVAGMNTSMTQLEEHVMGAYDVKERELQNLLRDDPV
ncbi:hypothetical protein LEL_02059 [Akanthomyces lecanii RCEF 1005]|uniref:Uncharacterized protein n=1 Tax=Akanthomyces lecanii RCEF 1005 TaxID=1081108 RepID=A0A168KZY8_CORDF|nr:hypothetical protein LEL_02059 [Akanthomyces lecanii RCEF 1005]